MSESFSAYPALLHCGICRSSIDLLPAELSAFEQELLALEPPTDLVMAHSPNHLVSFARHVADIVTNPVQRVEVAGQVFHAILGVVVYRRNTDGTISAARWQSPVAESQSWLVDLHPADLPILDFPSTSLWHEILYTAFLRESRARLASAATGELWAQWAWSFVRERIIDPINLKRLRTRICAALELDPPTLILMRWFRRFDAGTYSHTVGNYNGSRRERDALLELKGCSPLFPLLARWLYLPPFGVHGSVEVSARFKHATRSAGLKPLQWKLLSAPTAPLMPLWKVFVREFMGSPHRDPAEDFLKVIALLKPTRRLDTEVWRTILSMAGTRTNAPASYAQCLSSVSEPLQHLIRLMETGKSPRNSQRRNAELHEICAWVADQEVRELLPGQRRKGWMFLVQSARKYAEQRARALQLESLQWCVPIHPVTIGGYSAVPLTCGRDLWEESIVMRHCADQYGERCKSGTTLLVSVRDAAGRRRATLAIERRDGDWTVVHVAGPANKHVGKEFDELIDAILSLLSVVDSALRSPMKGPHYRIDVLDNFGYRRSWTESTFKSARAALDVARRICRSGLPSRDGAGRDMWRLFGETPIILALDGAEPLEFDAHDYIDSLCGKSNYS